MKTMDQVSAEKLRGGFYSPDELVHACFERVKALTVGRRGLRLLEPSAGDGAFIRGLATALVRERVADVLAIELLESEAVVCRSSLSGLHVPGEVIVDSAVEWAITTNDLFDIAVGNPPFVRFQFVRGRAKEAVAALGSRLGVPMVGVSNLWIPVFLGALSRIRTGGAFAFIIPTECFTGISAGHVRRWLLHYVEELRLDLFAPGTFDGVLQEVLVVSGRVDHASRRVSNLVTMAEHSAHGAVTVWTHYIRASSAPWTKYLLSSEALSTFDEALHLPGVVQLGRVARFEVAAVTGANEYFSADQATVEQYDLAPWARPLLARIRHAPGLVYTSEDHERAAAAGVKAYLLHFSADASSPESGSGSLAYLEMGRRQGLPLRYKCRIREPWYRVPHVRAGSLMLSKRSHRFPRLVLNPAAVVTTDTVYRGEMRGEGHGRQRALTAGFHNSLTLLSAEMEGRTFGGGVLELVPTEIARLSVVVEDSMEAYLQEVDEVARAGAGNGQERLIEVTNDRLVKSSSALSADLLHRLDAARRLLLQRRMDRNARPNGELTLELVGSPLTAEGNDLR
jgi:adenine-specific DNA-methyltransferase